jgi:hypothetical protein
MSLFFDADWFDARLAHLNLDRAALAESAGMERAELQRLFTNERAATAQELSAFATLLGADIIEVTLHAGIAAREPAGDGDPAVRIEDIEARLDAIDSWIAEMENGRKSA